MKRIGVMHLTDTLDAGGAEKMAVNIVNMLPRERYAAHLCTTRRDGALDKLVTGGVARLSLGRTQRFDVKALQRMTTYIRENEIQILHAHGTSLFAASLASLFPPNPAVVWHDHYGRYRFDDRPAWLYRFAARRISAVIAVNQQLAEWAIARLHLSRRQVSFVPNFVCDTEADLPAPDLPGKPGARIACVANFRPEKDHSNLIRAMALLVRSNPDVHLLLMGQVGDEEYFRHIRQEIAESGLGDSITILGQRSDVAAILRGCDVGVLSSASEGLPLALLEYGMAGLAAVATNVGQCADVLDGGRVGRIVAPGNAKELSAALLELIRSGTERKRLAASFRARVKDVYSPEAVLDKVVEIYANVARFPATAGDLPQ